MYEYIQGNPQIVVSSFFKAKIPQAIDSFNERQTVDDSTVDSDVELIA